MAATNRGTFLSGAGLVWRWQRLVWWVFFVSLIFGFFSTQEMTERASSLLDHNTAAQRLVKGFDISAIVLLQQLPDSPLEIQGHNIVHFSMLFVVFMLFATGGILSAYVLDEKPNQRAQHPVSQRQNRNRVSINLQIHRQNFQTELGGIEA